MGITIHDGGRVSSEQSIEALFEQSIAIAKEIGWLGNVPEFTLRRQNGTSFMPHADYSPLHLGFTRTRRFSDFCKTPFAGPSAHRQVLEFISLSAAFFKLVIYDETEDFELEEDNERFEGAFEMALEYIKQGLEENPGSDMKVRLPSGRIADIVQ